MDSERSNWEKVDWTTFQCIVAGLHATGDEDRFVRTEYDYKLPAGGSKEIDVYVKDTSSRYDREILIECKFQSAPVSQDIVDSLNGYLGSSGADKGVIISKSGFQSGAKERGKATGVELWTLKEFNPDEDLHNDLVQYLGIHLTLVKPNLQVTDVDLGPLDDVELKGRMVTMIPTPQNSRLYTYSKQPTSETLAELLIYFVENNAPGEYTEEFDNRAMLIEGEFYKLNSIEYEITHDTTTSRFEVDLFDKVDLTLKNELKDEQEFTSLKEALESFTEFVDSETDEY